MSISYSFGCDMNNRRNRDKVFDLDMDMFDNAVFGFPGDDLPPFCMRKYPRPWKNHAMAARDVSSSIKADKDKFQVNLDVQHFTPEEISVKTIDGYIVIEGKHEERKDDHGFVSRQFKRRYALPEECDPEQVESKLSSDGVLSVIAPKGPENKDERRVKIIQTGPVRKTVHEDPDEENGVGEEVEPPLNKKQR